MKNYLQSIFLGAIIISLPITSRAQTAQQSNVIENTVALQAAQEQCHYRVNFEMLGISLNAVGLQSTDLMPGGRYWNNVKHNQARIKELTKTANGKSSFCKGIRHNLSAMFD